MGPSTAATSTAVGSIEGNIIGTKFAGESKREKALVDGKLLKSPATASDAVDSAHRYTLF
jgi:hypothetical protein